MGTRELLETGTKQIFNEKYTQNVFASHNLLFFPLETNIGKYEIGHMFPT